MSSPEYSIRRNGNFFTVGNDQVGYKTFRLKISSGDQNHTVDKVRLEQIAERVFTLLQSSKVSYKSLANTKVTAGGIQTDQLESGKVTLIDAAELSQFDTHYETMSRITHDALKKTERSSKRRVIRKRPIKVEKSTVPPEEITEALKTSGVKIKKSRWPEFIMKIYEFFEKLIAPKKFKARHNKFANHLVSQSTKKINALKNFRLEDTLENPEVTKYGELGNKFAYVPKGIMLSQQERYARLRSKKIGAETAITNEHQMYKVVSPLKAGGITVTGYKINSDKGGGVTIRENRVIPTAFRHSDDKKAKHDRLANCYMATGNGRGLIRTGVVDSAEKVKELVIAARELNTQMGRPPPSKERPLRIISHQLNSPEVEGSMIKNQHMNLAVQDHEMEDVEIAHINTPCNRFYHITKSLEKRGLHFFEGEKKSRSQNVEGMARYLVWLVEDLERLSKDESLSQEQRDKFILAVGKLQLGNSYKIYNIRYRLREINKTYPKLQKKQVELNEKKREKKKVKISMGLMNYFGAKMQLNAEINMLEHEVESLKNEIEALRTNICDPDSNIPDKGILYDIYDQLKNTIENGVLAGDDPVIQRQRETITLYRKLLGNHYRFESIPKSELMERGQELMMFQLLNQRMGVISGVNCKSGLDRTGFIFAMMMGLMQCPEDQALDIATNWDQYTRDLNSKMKEFEYDTTKLYQWLDEPVNPELKEIYRTILDFRLNVFNNLLNVSLPITAVSTGLFGLKWGSGFQENLIPLNFIPPVVQVVNEEGKVELVRILKYSDKGNVEGLTKMGHRLLTQMSPRRGA